MKKLLGMDLSKLNKDEIWMEYKEIIKDKLEPEFQLSEQNKSEMILYGNTPTFEMDNSCFK